MDIHTVWIRKLNQLGSNPGSLILDVSPDAEDEVSKTFVPGELIWMDLRAISVSWANAKLKTYMVGIDLRYREFLRDSYRRNREIWQKVLEYPGDIILTCRCGYHEQCHRGILAKVLETASRGARRYAGEFDPFDRELDRQVRYLDPQPRTQAPAPSEKAPTVSKRAILERPVPTKREEPLSTAKEASSAGIAPEAKACPAPNPPESPREEKSPLVPKPPESLAPPTTDEIGVNADRIGFPNGVPTILTVYKSPTRAFPLGIRRFVAVDFEAADEKVDSACALGLVRVEDGRIVQRWSGLFCPPRPPNAITYSVHGLSMKVLQNQPKLIESWPEFSPILEGVDAWVAHNAGYDKRFLKAAFEASGKQFPMTPFYCTQKLCKEMWPEHPSRLNDVCSRFGIKLNHHEAGSDSEACARIVVLVRQILESR